MIYCLILINIFQNNSPVNKHPPMLGDKTCKIISLLLTTVFLNKLQVDAQNEICYLRYTLPSYIYKPLKKYKL